MRFRITNEAGATIAEAETPGGATLAAVTVCEEQQAERVEIWQDGRETPLGWSYFDQHTKRYGVRTTMGSVL